MGCHYEYEVRWLTLVRPAAADRNCSNAGALRPEIRGLTMAITLANVELRIWMQAWMQGYGSASSCPGPLGVGHSHNLLMLL